MTSEVARLLALSLALSAPASFGQGLSIGGGSGFGSGDDEFLVVYAPLHRLDLPEPPARGITLQPLMLESPLGVVLVEDQDLSPPDPSNPSLYEGHNSPFPQLLVEAYPWHRLGLGYEFGSYGDSQRNAVQAKVHLLGPGSLSLAVTYRHGFGTVDHDGLSSQTNLQTRMHDGALIAGWRTRRWLLLYGGLYRQEQTYDGMHDNSNPPGGGPALHVPVEGDVTLTGFNLGLSVSPASRWSSLVVEYSGAQVDAGDSSSFRGSLSAAIRFNFGWRLTPSASRRSSATGQHGGVQ